MTVGPYDQLQVTTGVTAPLYLVPFDKHGTCEGPRTLDHVVSAVASNQYTDVHVFSHGWNNMFQDALARYRGFFQGYLTLRGEYGLNDPEQYRPLFVGVLWPSTLLVMPRDAAPAIAGGDRDEAAAADRDAVRDLAAGMGAPDRARFYELTEANRDLTPPEELELARLLRPIYERPDDAVGTDPAAVSAEDLVKAWRRAKAGDIALDDGGEGGFARDSGPSPTTAGLLGSLNPVWVIRMASVWQMKDRAGVVGANGVGLLLGRLLAESQVPIHLTGHSYGCKVVLSALCTRDHPRPVRSILLLQGAVSCYCFAEDVGGRPGGYRVALGRVERPILSTFSSADGPLTKFFHLAVRRESDWGEGRVAGVPPSRFAALGGFGPQGLGAGEERNIAMPDAPTLYPAHEGYIGVYGVNGSDGKITGHGDIDNRFTQWALVNAAAGDQLR